MAFGRVSDAAGVDALSLPVHFVIWFPQMGEAAFTWRPSPHIWTREAIAVGAIGDLVRRALTARASAAEATALQRLLRTLGEGRGWVVVVGGRDVIARCTRFKTYMSACMVAWRSCKIDVPLIRAKVAFVALAGG
jgi:hypothetical protein